MYDRQLLAPTRQRRFGPALSMAVILLLVLTGCTSGVSAQEVGETSYFVDSGFLTGDEAAISGTLAVTANDCIGIESSGEIYPTVWPRGTRLHDEHPVALEIPGVGVKQLGDRIEGSGGYYETDRFDVLSEVAARCEWSGEVIGVRFD